MATNSHPYAMYIENDPISSYLVTNLMEKWYPKTRVHVCEHGEEAIVKLRKDIKLSNDLPGLIILDWYMPFVNGKGFLEMKKSLQELIDIPIVVLSNSVQVKDRREAMHLGCLDFINKPINKNSLDAMMVHLSNS